MAIAFGSAGSVATGSTSLSIGLPSGGLSAGELVTVQVNTKPGATASIALPTGWGGGWYRLAESVGTTGTNGNDTGPTRTVVFAKIATGSESGSLSVAITSGNSSTGVAVRWTATTGFTWDAFTGQDTSSGTGYSASCAAYAGAISPGDMVVAFTSGPSDTVTWGSHGFTATGLTFGARTEITELTTSTGNDIGGASWYATVSSGTMSGTAVLATATLSSGTNAYGPAVVIRLRDEAPTTPRPVDAATGSADYGAASSVAVTPPAGASVKHLAFITYDGSTLTPPSGWSLVTADADDWGQVYESTTSPGTTWSFTVGDAFAVVVIGYDTDFDATASSWNGTSTSPSMTLTDPALVARFGALWHDTTTPVAYPNTETLGRAQASANPVDGGPNATVAHKVQQSGSTGTVTWPGYGDDSALTLLIVGVSVPEGTAAGGFSYAGTAAGTTTRHGSTSGGFGFAGTAAGEAPSSPPNEGTSSGGFSFVGAASGEAPDVPPSEGTATGGFGFADSAAGQMSATGTATGGFAYSGAAAGSAPKGGAAVGGALYAGSATGRTVQAGSAAGGFAYAGSATSSDISTGSATGGYLYAGTGFGARAAEATATGTFFYGGSAAGATARSGTAVGGFLFTGAATSTVVVLRDINVTVLGPNPNPLTIVSLAGRDLPVTVDRNPITVVDHHGNPLTVPSPRGNPLTVIGGPNG